MDKHEHNHNEEHEHDHDGAEPGSLWAGMLAGLLIGGLGGRDRHAAAGAAIGQADTG